MVVTFLLELPYDVGVRHGATISAYERRSRGDVEFFRDDEIPDSLRTDSRFVFRRAAVAGASAGAAAMAAFSDFWEGLQFVDSGPALDALEAPSAATVVAASTGAIVEEVDGVGHATERELTALFERVLRQLNEFLTMLGFSAQNPEIGAVRRTELPTHIPVVLDIDLAGTLPRHAELATMQLHGFATDPVADATVLYAHDLAFRDRDDSWPFKPIVTLLHRALRDRYAGVADQAVIELGTAVELLAELVVRESLRRDGASAERVGKVLQAGLTNLLRDHVVPILARQARDRDAAERWIRDCYQLRKQVVHEGHTPTVEEIRQAFHATNDLASEIGEALRSDPRLALLGDVFPLGRPTGAR